MYIDSKGYLVITTQEIYGMEVIQKEKKYKVNKKGLFEEIK